MPAPQHAAHFCEMWIGISAAENARRCKLSPANEGGSLTATSCGERRHLRLNRRYHEKLEGPATPGARPSGLKLLPEKETHLREFSITHNKIEPIYRFCKTLIGRRRGQRHTTPPFCEMWIGISAGRERQALQAIPGSVGDQPLPLARTGAEPCGLRSMAVEALQDRGLQECVPWMSYVE